MIFREAGVGDVERIANLHAKSWRAAYRGILSDAYLDNDVERNRLEVWTRRFHPPRPNQIVFAADAGGELAGFSCAYGGEDPRWGTMVDNLHVQPHLKGSGLGTQLLARAAGWAGDRYPSMPLFLWVYENNRPARGFYERLSGRLAEIVEADVPGGGRARECRYVWENVEALARLIYYPGSPSSSG